MTEIKTNYNQKNNNKQAKTYLVYYGIKIRVEITARSSSTPLARAWTFNKANLQWNILLESDELAGIITDGLFMGEESLEPIDTRVAITNSDKALFEVILEQIKEEITIIL